ncbi:MAG: GMC family oxidoreductase [Gammaproteobacteria bacterium]|nr:GMC family oxidoreductase [Gammaproteobacteria bacterium]
MFDLIIVGAGSAGAAIAARATEDPNLSVLLVEAGPDYPDLAATPFDLVNSHNNSYTAHDWGFRYEPVRGREVSFPRGRVIGGSSAVNTTIALRGVPEDYDEWAALGNTEWSWNKVLPAFNRLERDLDYGDEDYHGDAGPITIRRYPPEEMLPQHQAFLDTASQLGYPDCPDHNDPESWGSGPQPMNKLGRLRISCAVGYLAPARIRPNLTIRADTFVRRLVDRRAPLHRHRSRKSGRDPRDDWRNDRRTRRGALMSPAILDAFGHRTSCAARGARYPGRLRCSGVGQNLCDHPALSVAARVTDPSIIDVDQPIIQTILRYTAEGSEKRNDLQIEQISFAGRGVNADMIAIAAVLEYQYGRGELRLAIARSPRPPDCRQPISVEDPRDTTRLVGCLKDALAFTRQGPIKDVIDEVVFPDPGRGTDDETLASLCRKLAGSGYHPCGTVKMGPDSDLMAVVDQYGCSHAMDNLVIADASIMPFVPRANTNLTAIMIGEKIGEWIRTGKGRYGL